MPSTIAPNLTTCSPNCFAFFSTILPSLPKSTFLAKNRTTFRTRFLIYLVANITDLPSFFALRPIVLATLSKSSPAESTRPFTALPTDFTAPFAVSIIPGTTLNASSPPISPSPLESKDTCLTIYWRTCSKPLVSGNTSVGSAASTTGGQAPAAEEPATAERTSSLDSHEAAPAPQPNAGAARCPSAERNATQNTSSPAPAAMFCRGGQGNPAAMAGRVHPALPGHHLLAA
mmetsp:Transcript_9247/g.26586  ORF Transcript_9247/g.26586 Transcript_9247/m.26586 type:complete len:231 (+) Transcript_9247:1366-2058(+)